LARPVFTYFYIMDGPFIYVTSSYYHFKEGLMNPSLQGIKVAILVADGFEQSEMTEPKKALEALGAYVVIISPSQGKVRGWQHRSWGDAFDVNQHVHQANAREFDALLLPGGVMNPDTLRMDSKSIEFVKHFIDFNKPIAAICHGPWTLINAGGVEGKTMTSWPSIQMDLINAGARWVDKEVVQDGNLITSRKPEDIPAFNRAIMKRLAG